MGNTADGPRTGIGKTLTEENVAELSALSGFRPEQVREWHASFLVIIFQLLTFMFNDLIRYECIREMILLKMPERKRILSNMMISICCSLPLC